MRKYLLRIFVFALAAAYLPVALAQQSGDARSKALDLASQAVQVLGQIEKSPDRSIPLHLLRNARAVVVVPTVVKAGFIFGARHGVGLVSVRQRNGQWSYPSYVDLSGGSVGFQAGISSTDVILVFRTQHGVDGLVNGKFTLGADAAVAAGPVGRNAHAATDAQLNAEIFSYSRSHGLFAGVSFSGSALTIDYDRNATIYGPTITPRRIFEGGVTAVPTPLANFRAALDRYSQPTAPAPAASGQ